MSLSQSRTFLKQQIALAEPDLKEWRDSFDAENIPNTLIDTYYHISFGSLSSTNGQNWIEDDWDCSVTIWKKGFSDPVTAFDAIMDTANCIRLKVVDTTAELIGNIKNVSSVSVISEPIEASNDNTIKVILDFNIKLFFTTS